MGRPYYDNVRSLNITGDGSESLPLDQGYRYVCRVLFVSGAATITPKLNGDGGESGIPQRGANGDPATLSFTDTGFFEVPAVCPELVFETTGSTSPDVQVTLTRMQD